MVYEGYLAEKDMGMPFALEKPVENPDCGGHAVKRVMNAASGMMQGHISAIFYAGPVKLRLSCRVSRM